MARTRVLAVLLLVVIAVVSIAAYIASRPMHRTEFEHQPVSHARIMIAEDGDFTTIEAASGCQCVREGSGSQQDPYIVSDWIVNATQDVSAITVFGTTAYFTIRRVQVQGDTLSVGIYLERVENGRIERSLVAGNFIGVYAFLSRNLAFTDNLVSSGNYGIQLEASDNSLVVSNSFQRIGDVAIFIRGSSNVVKDNRVSEGAFGGINIDGTSAGANYNKVENNTVTGTTTYGISVWRGASNVIRGNTVARGRGLGIALTEGSTNNSVEANLVIENQGDGIAISEESSQNTIRSNTAKSNGDGVRLFDLHDTSGGNVWESNTYETKNPEALR